MRLSIKAVPGSSTDAIAGWIGDSLKIRVRAKAEKGRANAAIEEILCKTLELPRSAVRVTIGLTSVRKVVQIDGLPEDEVRRRFTKPAV